MTKPAYVIAAEIRAAAEKIRTLATAAAHEDRTRWEVGHTLGSKSRVVVDNHERPTVLIETWAKHREQVDDYLAAFASPAVALAVADWLGCEAQLDPEERGGPECGWCGLDHAQTIARALTPTT